MATQYCFIAGTDTGAGKTWVTVQLIQHYQNQGKSVLAYKPIASGIDAASNMNEDVFLLKQSMAHAITNQRMNPFLFEQPIAPHIANEQRKLDLSVASLSAWWQAECQTHSQVDLVLIEGCGGWLLPLNDHETFADWVVKESLPIILVVGMRLGCLNHTLLTTAQIEAQGGLLSGWIANTPAEPMAALEQNRQCLKDRIKAPLLFDFS